MRPEILRDTVLYLSGRLDERPLKSQIYERGDVPVGDIRRRTFESPDFDVRHRSVYLPIVRGYLPDSLQIFDFAEPTQVVGTRTDTVVPSQALYMMNSDFVQRNARAFGKWLAASKSGAADRIEMAYNWVLSRNPSDEEEGFSTEFLRNYTQLMQREGVTAEQSEIEALAALAQSLYGSAEFRYLN